MNAAIEVTALRKRFGLVLALDAQVSFAYTPVEATTRWRPGPACRAVRLRRARPDPGRLPDPEEGRMSRPQTTARATGGQARATAPSYTGRPGRSRGAGVMEQVSKAAAESGLAQAGAILSGPRLLSRGSALGRILPPRR